MLSSRMFVTATATRTLRAMPKNSSICVPLFARRTSGQYSALSRATQLQFHAAFSTKRNDDDFQTLPPLQTVDELIAENDALKKELAELKEKASKAKPGLMATIKQYGMPFFFWWTGLYVATGVGLYGAFDTGLLDGAQVIQVVMDIGLDKFIDPTRLDPKHGNLALTVIVNETIEPIRFAFALATISTVKKAFTKDKGTPSAN